jgi:hypothetical protein
MLPTHQLSPGAMVRITLELLSAPGDGAKIPSSFSVRVNA